MRFPMMRECTPVVPAVEDASIFQQPTHVCIHSINMRINKYIYIYMFIYLCVYIYIYIIHRHFMCTYTVCSGQIETLTQGMLGAIHFRRDEVRLTLTAHYMSLLAKHTGQKIRMLCMSSHLSLLWWVVISRVISPLIWVVTG